MAANAGGTAVGIEAADAVVLAANSRATSGGAVTGSVQRVEQVHETGATATVGPVGDAQAFTRALDSEADRRRLEDRPLSAASLATRAGDLAAEHGVDALVGAVTPDADDHLFLADAGGGVTTDDFAAIGAGQQFALGALESGYEDDLSPEAARDLAVAALRTVGERSAGDGGRISVAVVTADGVEIEDADGDQT